MRAESLAAWKTRSILAIAFGAVGGQLLCIYAVLKTGVVGMAHAGCTTPRCAEATIAPAGDHHGLLFDVGLFGGSLLALAGVLGLILVHRARRASRDLPTASVV